MDSQLEVILQIFCHTYIYPTQNYRKRNVKILRKSLSDVNRPFLWYLTTGLDTQSPKSLRLPHKWSFKCCHVTIPQKLPIFLDSVTFKDQNAVKSFNPKESCFFNIIIATILGIWVLSLLLVSCRKNKISFNKYNIRSRIWKKCGPT